MPNKKRKNENFQKQKNLFFLMSQGSLDPKIRFLGQKVLYESDLETNPFYIFVVADTLFFAA